MSDNIMTSYKITIRPRRQVTLPSPFLRQLGLEIGDSLEAQVVGKKVYMVTQKQVALNALSEIQRVFKNSKVKQKAITKAIDKQRLSQ